MCICPLQLFKYQTCYVLRVVSKDTHEHLYVEYLDAQVHVCPVCVVAQALAFGTFAISGTPWTTRTHWQRWTCWPICELIFIHILGVMGGGGEGRAGGGVDFLLVSVL